jgi:hypothetical protein
MHRLLGHPKRKGDAMPLPALLARTLDLELFERFQQSPQSRYRRKAGRGIGIASVARELSGLSLHRGNLR